MGPWSVAVNILFPLPLALILLLSIPLPEFCRSFVRKILLRVVDIVFWKLPIPILRGYASIYGICTFLSLVLFGLTSWETLHAQQKSALGEKLLEGKCIRWRYERNFWISFLSCVVWIVLYKMRQLIREVEMSREHIRALEKPKKNE